MGWVPPGCRHSAVRVGLGLTVGAETREGDLCGVDLESVVFDRGETRCRSDRAGNVFEPAAVHTQEVVVVIPHPHFVVCGAARWFDLAHETRLGERREDDIHRLQARTGKFPLHDLEQLGSIEVAARCQRFEHGTTRRSGAQSRFTQELRRTDTGVDLLSGHDSTIALF